MADSYAQAYGRNKQRKGRGKPRELRGYIERK